MAKNGHGKNGVTSDLSGVNIHDMMATATPTPPVDLEAYARRQRPFEPDDPQTAEFLDRHQQSKDLVAKIHRSLDPIIIGLKQEHPDSIPQIAEVLTGWEQRLRDEHEAKRLEARKTRRRHGDR